MKKAALFSLLALFAASAAWCGESSRSLFVSVIQDRPVLSSRKEIRTLVDFAKKSGAKTLFVQVYRANKCWFPSVVGDDWPYRDCLKKVGEDPLALLLREAHAEGLQVHAWMNLMSLSANANAPLLKKYGPEILTCNILPKKTLSDYKIDHQYFLEPGDPRVVEETAAAVTEVVKRYPELDGVQFDYIRYPDWHPWYGHTAVNERRFREATGAEGGILESDPAWRDWKRAQVTALLDRLTTAARAAHPGITVSTTGLVAYSRAFHEGSQDWKLWLETGRVEFVTLMCYSRSTDAFRSYIGDARKQLGGLERINIAVGAYKLSPRFFREQYRICEEAGSRDCAIFHYGDLVEHPALAAPLVEPGPAAR